MSADVPMPDWKTSGLGSKKRVALWLLQVVGEGNVFTKEQLRDDFREVQQIDRRLRDLRADGWKIDTNREDAGLSSKEQRFVQRGLPVWESNVVSAGASTISSIQRRDILRRDNHMCRSCGIGPGEPYPDGGHSQLDIARRVVQLPDGDKQVQLLTECNRCRIGNGKTPADLRQFLSDVDRLPFFEGKMLAGWIAQGSRPFNAAEALWALYATLPADARKTVQESLS
jgi:hypothetical protein